MDSHESVSGWYFYRMDTIQNAWNQTTGKRLLHICVLAAGCYSLQRQRIVHILSKHSDAVLCVYLVYWQIHVRPVHRIDGADVRLGQWWTFERAMVALDLSALQQTHLQHIHDQSARNNCYAQHQGSQYTFWWNANGKNGNGWTKKTYILAKHTQTYLLFFYLDNQTINALAAIVLSYCAAIMMFVFVELPFQKVSDEFILKRKRQIANTQSDKL